MLREHVADEARQKGHAGTLDDGMIAAAGLLATLAMRLASRGLSLAGGFGLLTTCLPLFVG